MTEGPLREPTAVRERIWGGMYGLLVGDALGVPYEFSAPQDLPTLDELGPELPPGFQRAHPGAPRGAWSDDGAQALCLLESLLVCGELDLGDLARRLVDWRRSGHWAVEGRVFDVGAQTSRALRALQAGVEPELAGPSGEFDNGNGSLMRVLPLALWHQGSDAELTRDAARQSLVTHGHPRSQVCCALYCLWARALVEGAVEAWPLAVERFRSLPGLSDAWRQELDLQIRPNARPRGEGSGYVVDSLNSVRLALEESSYASVVRRAISFGNDTDTTAALAGGLAGVRHGYSAIPADWRAHLATHSGLEPLLEHFIALRFGGANPGRAPA